jgi:glycosyltransferase involved in cell wall biosynthesis
MTRHIMLLNSSLFIGGAEQVIANLARHLDRSRFRVTIAHLKQRGGVGDELLAEGFDVVGVPRSEGPSRYLSFRALGRVIRDRHVDLVHSHSTYSLLDGALCRLGRVGGIKLIHTFHYGNYPLYRARYALMERFASRAADHLVAVGHEQMAIIRSMYRPPANRLSVIANGTDANPPSVDPAWASRLAQDGRVVVGTTATFIEQKGLGYLLDVAALIEAKGGGAVFVVVGDGALRAGLEQRCREMGLERSVIFAGWQPRAAETMTPLYDILLQPSLWEAMSVVVIEAMAAAKPVVVTDAGDNRHVVRDGETGFVVPVRDAEAMAARLGTLIASRDLRRQFGLAGRARYEAHYTSDVMTRAYEQLYGRVIGQDPAGHSPAPSRHTVSAGRN